MAIDVTDETFETEVLDRSVDVPVVVDLWAEWCGPCKTLGPVLEKVVGETNGAVALAKVDVDANPRVSEAFRVQSIPAVFALRNRQVVDSFIGAVPEPAVRQFVDRLAPAPTEVDRLIAAGDEASLRTAVELEPGNERAITALAEYLVGQGHNDEALSLLERIPETAETRRVGALARLGAEAALAGGGPAATNDGVGVEAKLDALLDRVKDDEAARQEFIDLLEIMGPDDPRTAQYRRALAARLF
jgi:putative thioredoxin